MVSAFSFFFSLQFTRKKEGCHIAKSIKSIPIRQTKDYTKKQSNFNKNEIRFLFWKTFSPSQNCTSLLIKELKIILENFIPYS